MFWKFLSFIDVHQNMMVTDGKTHWLVVYL